MEHIRRILIPTDGSSKAREAVREGVSFARVVDASVTALFVVDTTTLAALPEDESWATLRDTLADEGRGALAHVETAAREAGVPVTTRLEEGHPATVIVDVAKDGFDLVVMATLGRTGLAHLLLGSVTERVIRHAPCPVLVVRATP